MPIQSVYNITESRELCPGTQLIKVCAPDMAAQAKPGQFVHISCGEGLMLRRPISICHAKNDELWLVVENRGKGTEKLISTNVGDKLDILGPLGNGFSIPEGRVAVIGGGLGVPPMLYAAACADKADAILGFRNESRLILTGEFGEACDGVYITTDDGSYGEHGAVTLPLSRLLAENSYSAVLACGPKPMLKAIAELCDKHGVACQVSMEERMGCGIGACLVCACKTKKDGEEHMSRVCKDGPVFNASEVVW